MSTDILMLEENKKRKEMLTSLLTASAKPDSKSDIVVIGLKQRFISAARFFNSSNKNLYVVFFLSVSRPNAHAKPRIHQITKVSLIS